MILNDKPAMDKSDFFQEYIHSSGSLFGPCTRPKKIGRRAQSRFLASKVLFTWLLFCSYECANNFLAEFNFWYLHCVGTSSQSAKQWSGNYVCFFSCQAFCTTQLVKVGTHIFLKNLRNIKLVFFPFVPAQTVFFLYCVYIRGCS